MTVLNDHYLEGKLANGRVRISSYRPIALIVVALLSGVGISYGNDVLLQNNNLLVNQAIYSSDGRTMLVYQGDGNLVLYKDGSPLWASHTVGTTTGQAVQQGDGNFVVYDAAGLARWHAHTYPNPGAYTKVVDGGAVVCSTAGSVLWSATGRGACSGAQAPTPNPVTPGGYLGCYTDSSDRALPVLIGGSYNVDRCISEVRNRGYTYAGLQWYGECWAGNSVGYTKADDSECNTPCNANQNQVCGGAWRNSIYSTGGSQPSPPSPSPSPSPNPTPAANGYIGCYTDDWERALPALIGEDYDVDRCIRDARKWGYAYAGLQWYGQCWGGTRAGYVKVADSDCNTPCNANQNQICGGAWRNSVYSIGRYEPNPSPPPDHPDDSKTYIAWNDTVPIGSARMPAKNQAPCGSQCRGTCGSDCPDQHGNRKTVVAKDCDPIEGLASYRTYYVLGTHSGCRNHDACYDRCNTRFGCFSWDDPFATIETEVCMRDCDWLCLRDYGLDNCSSWMNGGGPYDDHWEYTLDEWTDPDPGCSSDWDRLRQDYRDAFPGLLERASGDDPFEWPSPWSPWGPCSWIRLCYTTSCGNNCSQLSCVWTCM